MKKLILLLPLVLIAGCDSLELHTCRAAVDGLPNQQAQLDSCVNDVYDAQFKSRQKAAQKYRDIPR